VCEDIVRQKLFERAADSRLYSLGGAAERRRMGASPVQRGIIRAHRSCAASSVTGVYDTGDTFPKGEGTGDGLFGGWRPGTTIFQFIL